MILVVYWTTKIVIIGCSQKMRYSRTIDEIFPWIKISLYFFTVPVEFQSRKDHSFVPATPPASPELDSPPVESSTPSKTLVHINTLLVDRNSVDYADKYNSVCIEMPLYFLNFPKTLFPILTNSQFLLHKTDE